ncbi:MAG: serine/threonine-protein kinase, partial [Pseudomonadota bacterium]
MNENQDELQDDLSRIPGDLIIALLDMLEGHRSFSDFRDELANALYADSKLAGPIERWIATRRGSQAIPTHLQRLLVNDVQRICTEDVPTLIDTSFSETPPEPEPESAARSPISLVHSVEIPVGELTEPGKDESATGDKTSASLEEARGPSDPDKVGIEDEDSETTQVVTRGMVLCDRYELLERVSGGNMSLVFKARDRQQSEDTLVAIKILDPVMARNGRVLRALLDEYEKGRAYDHPSIVRYLGLEYHGSDIFLVLEWIEGETLAEILNRNPGEPYDAESARAILRELAAALQLIHDSGFVHGDVKPGNIMRMPDGHIKLLDFGVSRAFGEKRKTRIGFDASVLGAMTPAYASAGLLDGDELTPADDVYAFAALGVRMFSGSRVYGRATAMQARDRGLEPGLFDISTAEHRLTIERGVSHDTSKRPQLTELLEAFSSQPAASLPLNPLAGWRSRSLIALGLLVLAGVIGGLLWQQFGPNRISIDEPITQEGITSEELTSEAADVQPLASDENNATVDPVIEDTSTQAALEPEPKIETQTEHQRWLANDDERFSLQFSGHVQTENIQVLWPASIGVQSARVDLIAVDGRYDAPRLSVSPVGPTDMVDGVLELVLEVGPDDTLDSHQRYELRVTPVSQSEGEGETQVADVFVPNLKLTELSGQYPDGALSFRDARITVQEASGLVSLKLLRIGPLDQTTRA